MHKAGGRLAPFVSNDFIANTHAEAQGERVNANPCVAFTDSKEGSLVPSPGLGKAVSGADPHGTHGSVWVAVLKGGLFLMLWEVWCPQQL